MAGEAIGIGVIGVGGMGGRHALNLATHVTACRVRAVMDMDRDRAGEIASACGDARAVTDAMDLFGDPAVEAVIIASPDPTHPDLALACLEVKKPVLCEKPLAPTTDAAEPVIQAEVALGRRLIQLGFMRVFDPAHLAVKQAIDNGEIGRPLMFKGVHVNTHPVTRTLADVVSNSAVHDIHTVRWLMGEEVATVYTRHLPSAAGGDSCRLFHASLTLVSGRLATIEVNADARYGYEVSVELVGETGTVRSPSLASAVVRHDGAARRAVESDWLERFERAYVEEVQAWVASIVSGQPNGPTAWDGYAALAVADACFRSARTGVPEPVTGMDRPALYDRT